MKSKLMLMAVLAFTISSAEAWPTQPTTPTQCPDGTVTCNVSTQHMGDTSSSADNAQSQASNSGNSSVSNDSGMNNNGSNELQQSGNAVTQSPEITSSISGGNTNSTATGGSANGNKSDNSNSNAIGQANTGNSTIGDTSASGGNASASGGTVGDTSSTSSGTGVGLGFGGTGGSVGDTSASAAGGAGGTGGSSLAGSASNLSDSGNASQGQSQGQSSTNTVGQGQSSSNTLGQGQESTNSQSIGDTSADNSGGNSSVSVDASDRSRTTNINNTRYEAQTLFIPSQQAAAPSIVPGATATVIVGSCGPLQTRERSEVYGTYNGIFRKHQIYLGHDDSIYTDGKGDLYIEREVGGYKVLLGHRAIRTVAVLTVAGQRQIGLGGGNTGGGWGNGAVGGGSAMQRLVQSTDLELCEAFRAAEPRVEYIEVPAKKKPQ